MKRLFPWALSAVWVLSLLAAYKTGFDNATKPSAGAAASLSGDAAGPTAGSAPNASAGKLGKSAEAVAMQPAPWDGADTTDPLAKLRAALANPNTIKRTQGLLDALETLDSKGLREAADMIRSADDGMGGRWQTMLLMQAWGRIDPEAALAYNKEIGSRRADFSVYSAWAEVAPDAAIAHAAEANTGGDNWDMLGVVHGLVKTNPGKATSAVEAMAFGEARGRALDMVLDKLMQGDAAPVQDWVVGLSDERLRGGAAERVAARLADKDATRATSWVASLPDAGTRSRAMTGVIDTWAEQNPNAAGEWLNSLPASPETDAPRERFAYKVMETDQASAMAWADSIQDSERRSKAIERVARDWLEKDPRAAASALKSLPNPPESLRPLLGS